ncbi:efflux RND transporter periplasmic adaptor subunit [Neptuniibacter sp. CAU 1671]|uniref:efflux RND transporter periplasmic adaptor subunit n=1 Tax=Neptuniibacter sp. CAU 1671 TaxID=3032593 RepID=UPI0023D9847B|nr:efflux RND transporter periplasmic adaptor subunit [Neptuniibacter sp. CAU 1671]MDF2181797.1 efflux RND transporter periplasmic adaptor subunit [Neptuniibacter sp. CAU 1671]
MDRYRPLKAGVALCLCTLTLHSWAESFDCMIEPWMEVRLGSETQGVLDAVVVERGAKVQKGQVIARLVSDVQQASVKLAEARAANYLPVQIAKARQEYEEASLARKNTLHTRQLMSDQDIEEARTTLRLATLQTQEAQVESRLNALDLARTKALLKQREIVSPLDGLVMEKAMVPGEYVTEGEHIVTLAQINLLRAEGFLPLDMIDKVKPGDTIEVQPVEPVGGRYQGIVEAVDKVVDAASGTIGISVKLENPELKTLAGVKCGLSLVESQQETMPSDNEQRSASVN